MTCKDRAVGCAPNCACCVPPEKHISNYKDEKQIPVQEFFPIYHGPVRQLQEGEDSSAAETEDETSGGWTLAAIHEIIQDHRDREESERRELSVKLGNPDVLDIADKYNDIGYWKADGGVVAYLRRKDGSWNPDTRTVYTDQLIETLTKVSKQRPHCPEGIP